MKTAKLMFAGSLIGACASAAAGTDDVGGPGSALTIFIYLQATLCLMALPAIYIIFRRGLPVTKKLIWFLALAAVDIGGCGLLYLALFSHGHNELLFFTPIPWILVLLPGYIFAYIYKRAAVAQISTA